MPRWVVNAMTARAPSVSCGLAESSQDAVQHVAVLVPTAVQRATVAGHDLQLGGVAGGHAEAVPGGSEAAYRQLSADGEVELHRHGEGLQPAATGREEQRSPRGTRAAGRDPSLRIDDDRVEPRQVEDHTPSETGWPPQPAPLRSYRGSVNDEIDVYCSNRRSSALVPRRRGAA
jgi:hypothetical protein